jgi:glycosyltransferase involved in cell wall biosynthesis
VNGLRLAVVVQRYGADISGGAELHARYIAEHLARHAQVDVLTTCARDYVSWRNEFAPGVEQVHGIPVHRFAVSRERDEIDFGRRSAHVFERRHSLAEELAWLESEGPVCPELIKRLEAWRTRFDFVLLFSARYYHAYHGARAVPERAVLVPTAEREPSLGLAMFSPVFRGVRAIMYNSPEERALIDGLSSNRHVPGVVVGIGSEIPDRVEPDRARQKFTLRNPYAIYVGRIDTNKGCGELFDYFIRFAQTSSRAVDLVLIGTPAMAIPDHPRIRHLGYVSDPDKFDAIAAASVLVMPSYYESLSMVALEAWALGRPVLANARCDVLLGQCLRSNAGLYYEDANDFAGALHRLLSDDRLSRMLGRNGREYYMRHYAWPVIEGKYLDMFRQLSAQPPQHTMEPLPGFLARRARSIAPAAEAVNAAPAGAALPERRIPHSAGELRGARGKHQ